MCYCGLVLLRRSRYLLDVTFISRLQGQENNAIPRDAKYCGLLVGFKHAGES
jgi:hypothetical protein